MALGDLFDEYIIPTPPSFCMGSFPEMLTRTTVQGEVLWGVESASQLSCFHCPCVSAWDPGSARMLSLICLVQNLLCARYC